jgi:drug/metabolite transporter (DMT)-like permease
VKDIAKEFSGLIDSTAEDMKVLQDTKQSLVAQQTAAPKWWERVASSRVRGLVMLNLLVLLCGTNWVVVKDAGATFDPYLFASLRFLVASLVFAPGLLSAVKNETVLKGGVEVGIYTAMGYLLQSEGLLTTDASRASFLSTFTVLVVPFLAGLSGRGVRPVTWASSLAALVGVSLLEQNGSSPPCLGDIWSGLSAVAFGVQMYRTEHWSRVLGKDNAFALMSVVLTTTAVLSTLAAAVTHPGESLHLLETLLANSTGSMDIPWKEVLYTGFLTTDVVLLMEVVALNDVSSVEAAIIYTLEPVIGAAFAFIFLHERWGPMGWVGSGIIVASCLASQLLNQDTE